MEEQDLSIWRKSTYSGTGGANCVEVAGGTRAVLVRDTTDRSGPSLSIGAAAWREFLATL